MGTNLTGLAAAEALDSLLSASDFEPAVEIDVDTHAAVTDALDAAEELAARLTAYKRQIESGTADFETRIGAGADLRELLDTLSGKIMEIGA